MHRAAGLVCAGVLSKGAHRAQSQPRGPEPFLTRAATKPPALGRMASPRSGCPQPQGSSSRDRPKAASRRWALGPPVPDPAVCLAGAGGKGVGVGRLDEAPRPGEGAP